MFYNIKRFSRKDLPFNSMMKTFWNKKGFLIIDEFYTLDECKNIAQTDIPEGCKCKSDILAYNIGRSGNQTYCRWTNHNDNLKPDIFSITEVVGNSNTNSNNTRLRR